MKLELKHLAPYLPYGLNIGQFDNGFMFELEMVIDYKKLKRGNYVNIDYVDGVKYKPILRPLSDLTKEIEHNGEKFIPCKQLAKGEHFPNTYSFKIEIDTLNVVGYYTPESWLPLVSHYELWEKLFEWHFDVFGLIEKGLAIDINTLK